jgi:predicted DNA-binding transcriptional regulator
MLSRRKREIEIRAQSGLELAVEPKPDLKDVESELKGKTLLVYWHMLRLGRPVGVREIQRNLGFSSPSVAAHHLEKLKDLGLVAKDSIGQYSLANEVKVGLLKFFVKVGHLMLPRYLFYAVFMTSMLLIYAFEYGIAATPDGIIAVTFGTSASLILWYETIRIWLQKPF